MRLSHSRLFSTIAGAAFIVDVSYFGVVMALVGLHLGRMIVGVASLAILAVAIWMAARRLFTTFQHAFNRREAFAVAICFVIGNPISLGIASALYGVSGIVATALFKSRTGFFLSFFSGIAIISAFLTVLICALGLWITRITERAQSHG